MRIFCVFCGLSKTMWVQEKKMAEQMVASAEKKYLYLIVSFHFIGFIFEHKLNTFFKGTFL